jgi:adenosylmethionine-8-amino-7-oxononanoate aminotransferase
VIYPTEDYFPLVRQVCDRHQVLFIADEVITGFCRTGRWFAMEHWKVQPDIMSFAKGVSSGYLPLGGIMVSKAIKEAMDSVKLEDRWMHAYTYSGHPTCCAVGIANLAIMERERLWERAAAMGERLHKGLHAAFDGHPNLGDIRSGKGLLAAVELVEDKATKKMFDPDKKVGPRLMQEMTKRGLITRARLESIFFSPPLVISEEQLDRMIAITRDAVKAVTGA